MADNFWDSINNHGERPPATAAEASRRGIYVVAYGEPARRCARTLIASVHKYMPDVPVAVASDIALEEADISIVYADLDLGGRAVKTMMWSTTPSQWRQILYLDADTELVAPVYFLFDALDSGWELVISKDINGYDCIHSLWRRDTEELNLGKDAIGSDCALQLAGGVMAFRRTQPVKRFLEAWHKEWRKLARRDQGALIRAMYAHPVRMLVVGNEWNSFTGLFEGETAGILHHRGGPARRVVGWREGRLDDRRRWRHLAKGQPKRIHIICPETNMDSILRRLAQPLTEGTGWTLGLKGDPDADLNYGFPYLAQVPKPFAGWFTHCEDTVPAKVTLWEERARHAILRVTCAERYVDDLKAYGPTVLIPPPLDRAKFSPVAAHTGRTRPIAGVAGYIYSGGRKGETLLAEALKTEEGQAFDWRAIGRGWPVETKRIAYTNLQEFYQGLDLLVCTSIIEGVPYPPLEALACGVPIVIPRGVGLLDDLPNMHGIIRYDVGDATDLIRALDEAHALRRVDRDALRDATAPYTFEGWVQGHREMFDALEIPEVAYTDRRERKWVEGRGWVMGWKSDADPTEPPAG